VPNLIFETPSPLVPDTALSAIKGPRGSVTAFNFKVNEEMCGSSTGTADQKYNIFGTVDTILFEGHTDKYDYIDSPIYLEGTTSGAQYQVPIRIIRYAGT
jgi:hypothetical protein